MYTTVPKDDRIRVKKMIPLDKLTFESAEEGKNKWAITLTWDEKSITCACKTEELKASWMQTLRETKAAFLKVRDSRRLYSSLKQI